MLDVLFFLKEFFKNDSLFFCFWYNSIISIFILKNCNIINFKVAAMKFYFMITRIRLIFKRILLLKTNHQKVKITQWDWKLSVYYFKLSFHKADDLKVIDFITYHKVYTFEDTFFFLQKRLRHLLCLKASWFEEKAS